MCRALDPREDGGEGMHNEGRADATWNISVTSANSLQSVQAILTQYLISCTQSQMVVPQPEAVAQRGVGSRWPSLHST